jgi:hypothetical protein
MASHSDPAEPTADTRFSMPDSPNGGNGYFSPISVRGRNDGYGGILIDFKPQGPTYFLVASHGSYNRSERLPIGPHCLDFQLRKDAGDDDGPRGTTGWFYVKTPPS